MNKKIWIGSLLAVLMLVSISFISSAEINIKTETKESPLYRIRMKLGIGEKIQEIKAKLIGERIHFLPFQWIINRNDFSTRTILPCSVTGFVTMCDKGNANGC